MPCVVPKAAVGFLAVAAFVPFVTVMLPAVSVAAVLPTASVVFGRIITLFGGVERKVK